MENYPISRVLFRSSNNHSGSGQYNLLVEETSTAFRSTTTTETIVKAEAAGGRPKITLHLLTQLEKDEDRCSCGRGAA